MKTLYNCLCCLLLTVFLLLGLMDRARADTPYQLTFYVFATDTGHTALLSSYYLILPAGTFSTRAECEAQGNKSQDDSKGTPLPDGARLLPYFTCDQQR